MTESTRTLRYWQAELEALQTEMRRDPKIVLLGEDIVGAAGRESSGIVEGWGGPFGTTRGLVQEFGRSRVRDTPISEAAFLGAAAGLAEMGYRPWVEIMFPSFFGVCFDQLVTNVAQRYSMYGRRQTVPITIKTMINHHGALYGLIAHIPGIKVVAPSDPFTAKGLMIAALRDDFPVVVFDNASLLRSESEVPEDDYVLEIGRSRVVREGRDVTLVGMSATTSTCLSAASRLAEEGVDAEVIDLLSLVPLDRETLIASVSKTGRLLVVDEDFGVCGMSREVVAGILPEAYGYLTGSPRTLASPPYFRPFSPVLASAHSPSVDRVVAEVLDMVGSAAPAGPQRPAAGKEVVA